jgi:hypothetical protein
MENKDLVSTSHSFGQGFLSNKQYDNTGSSQMAPVDFHPLRSTEMSTEGMVLL